MSNAEPEMSKTAPDESPFATWWIVSNLEQIVENFEPAYGLTNALDALLGNAFTQSFDPNPEQVERIRATIRRIAPAVCKRIPIGILPVAQGLSAADHLIWHKYVGRDWDALSSKERWRIKARMKILRNVAHAIALDEEIGGQVADPDTIARATLFADNTSASAVRQVARYLQDGLRADDCLPDIVIGLRLLATAHAAGDLDRSTRVDLEALEPMLYAVANRLLAATDVPIGRDDVLHGVCAAIGLTSAPLMPSAEREDDRANDAERIDHVSMLAARLELVLREKRVAARGDGFRQEYRAIEARALRGGATMH